MMISYKWVIRNSMKNCSIFLILVSVLFIGCSPMFRSNISQHCLHNRTERLIKQLHYKADTVFLYSAAFNDYNKVWYHSNGQIFSFDVKPHITKRIEPVRAIDISLNKDSIDIYFDSFINKDILCFESVLDGEWIMLYVKNKQPLFCSVQTECLCRTQFKPNTLPYKLQYDFYKLGINPIDYSFDKVHQ